VDIKILDVINRQLQDRAILEFESQDRDYTHFHASQWDKCHRQIAYYYYYAKGLIKVDRSSLKNIINPVSQRIFDNGHSMHDRWRRYLRASGSMMGCWECMMCGWRDGEKEKLGILDPTCCPKCVSDKLIYHEIGFLDQETLWGGHVDTVLDVAIFRKYQLNLAFNGNTPDNYEGFSPEKPEDKYLLVDFKTMNPRQFNELQEPLPDHNTQMQIYLYLSDLKYGKFIYEDKWTQSVKEYLVVRDDNLLAVKKDEALRLKFIVENTNKQGLRVLPQRSYKERTHKECLRCTFRGHCWKD